MSDQILEMEFFLDEADIHRPCRLVISAPESSGEGSNYCRVQLTPLFSIEKRIFGAHELQAKELAIEFVRKFLADKKLVDQNGSPVQIDYPRKQLGPDHD